MQNQTIQFHLWNEEEQYHGTYNGLTVSLILCGACRIHVGKQTYYAETGELHVINPYSVHTLEMNEDGKMLCLQIPSEHLLLAGWTEQTKIAGTQMTGIPAGHARSTFARLFLEYLSGSSSDTITTTSVQLVSYLLRHFPLQKNATESIPEEQLKRLNRILNYIQEHAREKLTLSGLAKQEYISYTYLSHLFQQQLNMTFTNYLNSVRVSHATMLIRDTNRLITEIALDTGFPNINSFIIQFKRRYGKSPSQYRKQMQTPHGNHFDAIKNTLIEYAEQFSPLPEEATGKDISVLVDCSVPGSPITHNWKTLLNIGYAAHGLYAPVQAQLLRAQEEIGFRYLRFHGIFDEDMHIYQEDENGTPWFHFTYLDLLFDFILSAGFLPYIELGFIPEKLVINGTMPFQRRSYLGKCKDIKKWERLVKATVEHCIRRYGIDSVLQWKFSFFQITYAFFDESNLSLDAYLEYYSTAYHVLKQIHPDLSFGGPGYNPAPKEEGLSYFLQYVKEHHCPPDFFTFRCFCSLYDLTDREFQFFSKSQQKSPALLSGDESCTKHTISHIRELLDQHGFQDMELWLEEWNSTFWQQDLSGDTCFKSAWLTKNLLECDHDCHAMGYWLLSDFIDEWFVPKDIFHGGYGLFTANGIPKSSYHAFLLLNDIGNQKIDAGNGWFVSRKGRAIQLYLYHYKHYANTYLYRYEKIKRHEDAYFVFETTGNRTYHITLNDIPSGTYRIITQSISRKNGSAYDAWIAMGAPNELRQEEVQHLVQTAVPAYEVRSQNIVETFHHSITLAPHQVTMITLFPENEVFC